MRRSETVDERIREAGWFAGTEREWRALDAGDRAQLAFIGCGCAVAFPTWAGPVDCVHTVCQVARGELVPVVALNRALQAERASWLRDVPRDRLARLFKAYRAAYRETGITNPWRLSWEGIVWSGIGQWL